jgi:zinc protease
MEDHELPLISGAARIRGGSRDEPATKTGMLDIYGDVWRTGGTKTKTGDELDDFLEARAAKVETGSNADSTTIGFNTLKEHFDDVFAIFTDLLRNPEFRQEKIELAKVGMMAGISRRNDDVGEIAEREAARLAYGVENPYSRMAEYSTVGAVTREDLMAWHQQWVAPNNIILGITGDFDAKTMEAMLRKAFTSWPKGKPAPKMNIQFKDPKAGMYFIPRSDAQQSEVRMVHLGTTRNNPDYFAIVVLNEVLSGGSVSRLFSSIRTRQGLAYSVYGGVGTSYDHPGIFALSVGTKSETTDDAIRALHTELDKLAKDGITQEELVRGKESILNSFVFRFDSKEKILQERMLYEFYGYPANFLEQYRAGVEKVTAEDVARVARKYVHKDKLAVLVVGNPAEFDQQLSAFGQVSEIDIAIPEPAGKAPGGTQ